MFIFRRFSSSFSSSLAQSLRESVVQEKCRETSGRSRGCFIRWPKLTTRIISSTNHTKGTSNNGRLSSEVRLIEHNEREKQLNICSKWRLIELNRVGWKLFQANLQLVAEQNYKQ